MRARSAPENRPSLVLQETVVKVLPVKEGVDGINGPLLVQDDVASEQAFFVKYHPAFHQPVFEDVLDRVEARVQIGDHLPVLVQTHALLALFLAIPDTAAEFPP